MARKFTLVLMAVSVLLCAGGCSDKSKTPTGTENQNLQNDFGGYTTAAEKPAFGDQQLLGEDQQSTEYSDPIVANPSAQALMADVDAGLFHFRALWGRLHYDSTVTVVTDWSGWLTASRGIEVLRRVIRFEPGQDSILPRTEPNVIQWVSKTTVHNDGIAVDIFVPRPKPSFDTTFVITDDGTGHMDTTITVDTVFPAPVTVTFETGPYSRQFTLDELIKLDTVVQLEDGNAVAFQAFRLYRVPCPRGFLAGTWGFDEENKGVFSGVWMSQHGYIDGYVQGHFGPDTLGNKVFYGKWITRNGDFEGFLKGKYGFHPNEHANDRARVRAGGWLKGGIFAADGSEIGALKGRWGEGPRADKAHFFQARWKLHCANGINDDDGLDEDEIDCGDDFPGSDH